METANNLGEDIPLVNSTNLVMWMLVLINAHCYIPTCLLFGSYTHSCSVLTVPPIGGLRDSVFFSLLLHSVAAVFECL